MVSILVTFSLDNIPTGEIITFISYVLLAFILVIYPVVHHSLMLENFDVDHVL